MKHAAPAKPVASIPCQPLHHWDNQPACENDSKPWPAPQLQVIATTLNPLKTVGWHISSALKIPKLWCCHGKDLCSVCVWNPLLSQGRGTDERMRVPELYSFWFWFTSSVNFSPHSSSGPHPAECWLSPTTWSLPMVSLCATYAGSCLSLTVMSMPTGRSSCVCWTGCPSSGTIYILS